MESEQPIIEPKLQEKLIEHSNLNLSQVISDEGDT